MTDLYPPDPDDVLVFEVECPDAFSTIAIGHGLRESDGTMVRFVGDWREMLTVAAAIRDTGHPVTCSVPSYAVLMQAVGGHLGSADWPELAHAFSETLLRPRFSTTGRGRSVRSGVVSCGLCFTQEKRPAPRGTGLHRRSTVRRAYGAAPGVPSRTARPPAAWQLPGR